MENRVRNIDRGCFPTGAVRRMASHGFFVPIIVPFLLAFLCVTPAAAQRDSSDSLSSRSDNPARFYRFGALVALGLSAHDVSLPVYQSSPDCGVFSSQANTLYLARLFFETPLVRSLNIALTAGGVAQSRPVAFAETFSTVSRHPDGRVDRIVTQHRLDASITGYGAFAGLLWEPGPNIRFGVAPAFLFFGADDVRQYEEIVSPFGAVFTETNDYQRPIDRGEALSFSPHGVDLSFWAGATFSLGRHLRLMPEIGASLLLTSLEESTPWKTTTGYFGFGLAWHQQGEPDESLPAGPVVAAAPDRGDGQTAGKEGRTEDSPAVPDKPPEPVANGEGEKEEGTEEGRTTDTLVPGAKAPSGFWVEISAVGVDRANREYPDPVIEIREAPWSQSIPLIPYIFFDAGSPRIPSRYILFDDPAQADRFTTDSLIGPTPISLHHHLLNVLGQRLRARPEVAVTIVGTVSGDEGNSPEERNRLATARGEAVRRYFRDIWGIDERRIVVTPGKPTNPSSEETADGRAENRRAEFLFDGESLARPVVVERLARIASPPAIKFYPRLYKDSSATLVVADWHITVAQGEKELLRIEGAKNDSLTFERKYWSLGEMRINRDLTPIRYRLEVQAANGERAVAENSFIVQERTTRLPEERTDLDLEITEYLLAGFAYNSAELRPVHIAEIHEIARVADPGAWVDVTGFTDRVGDASRNYELAMERAQVVVDTLSGIRNRLSLPEIPIAAVRGLGGAGEGIYDNNFPEGRIFSRMVRVTVNRPSP